MLKKYEQPLLKALAKWHDEYDPKVEMIKKPFSSPGYHTTLQGGFVHPTRESLIYALALLDLGEVERAERIIRKVLSLQDTDPRHDTYGIWPWFYEEPLWQMAPSDWNWADFCGQELLVILLEHRRLLAEDLQETIKSSVFHAVNSIIRRDVHPGYTNIALIGAFVTLAAGEFFGVEEYYRYGKDRLKKVYQHTLQEGSFREYNSPDYTMIALDALARLRQYVRDPESRKLIESLYMLTWSIVAKHFHPPTCQWAGPYSRAYSNLQGAELWSRLQLGTRLKFVEELELALGCPRVDWSCPEELLPYFRELPAPRTERVLVSSTEKLLATTHLEKEFALGTFSKATLWNQTKALLAHWKGLARAASFQLRALHDGYDYCSAVLHSVQHRGSVLGAVNFATDGGDTHVNLDMVQEGTIRARDLRLRFEFSDPTVPLPEEVTAGELVTVKLGDAKLELLIAKAFFGQLPVSLEVGRSGGSAWLDLVFYQGEERRLDFRKLSAYAVFALRMCSAGSRREFAPVEVVTGSQLSARWQADGERLELETECCAAALEKLLAGEPGRITGRSVLDLARSDLA